MSPSSIASVVGYDVALLARMPPGRVRVLARVSEALLLSAVVLALPVGYLLWLVEHGVVLSVIGVLSTGLLVVNLLRVGVAGGGAAPHLDPSMVARHEPSWAPLVLLTLLSLLLAQPAQLPLERAAQARQIEAHRDELAAQRATFANGVEVADAHRDSLARCEFVVLRLRALWARPMRAVSLSAAYWLLVTWPLFFLRFAAIDAVRDYERLRYAQQRRLIEHHARSAQAEVERRLSRFRPSPRSHLGLASHDPFTEVRRDTAADGGANEESA